MQNLAADGATTAERDSGSQSVPALTAVDTLKIDWFHHATTWRTPLDADLTERIRRFLGSPEVRAHAVSDRKHYPECASTALPEATLGNMSLQHAITARRSLGSEQAPGDTRLTLDDLGAVLHFSYGITGDILFAPPFPRQPLRAAPSAGALYPLEIYPVIMDVEDMPAGIYHYDVAHHALSALRLDDTRNRMPGFEFQPGFRDRAGVVLVVTAVLRRTVAKYLERGYRFIHNDCGALLQNLYLTATARGLAGCAVGGFCDAAVASYVGVDNRAEIVTLMFVLGGRFP